MATHRNARTGALVSVRAGKVLGSEWEPFASIDPASFVEVAPAPDLAPADAEPPRAGKGSGRDAWAAHARDLGITVPDDAGRDDIIALVDEG